MNALISSWKQNYFSKLKKTKDIWNKKYWEHGCWWDDGIYFFEIRVYYLVS